MLKVRRLCAAWLTDLALSVFGTKGLGLFASKVVSSKYGLQLFESRILGYKNKYFGRFDAKFVPNGIQGSRNTGYFRTGWGWNGTNHVFRTSIGHHPKQLHIDYFFVP